MTTSRRSQRIRGQGVFDYPFPFVGAGEASYFEWAEVHVWFARVPSTAERTRIADRVPLPIADSIEFTGFHLAVASSQSVGRLIEARYGRLAKLPKSLTTTSRFKQAGSARVKRFNAHIEDWLHEAHSIVPIVVAYRRPDLEAGGTVLSAWHEASLARALEIKKQLGTPKAKGPAYMVKGIHAELEAAKPKGPTAFDQADTLLRAFMNIQHQKEALAAARKAGAALDGAEALWRAADKLADCIACNRQAMGLARAPARAIALDVFKRALVGKKPADHVRAFKFLIDEGCQAWRLPRILAIAIEAALRSDDLKSLDHFRRGLDPRRKDQLAELERSAKGLEEEGLLVLASNVRAISASTK
jgi:hypothetical protein